MTGQSEKLEKVRHENNYFLQYIKFAGQYLYRLKVQQQNIDNNLKLTM